MTPLSKDNGLWRARWVASLVVVLCLAPAGTAGALPPSAPAPGAYVTDGPVQAIAHAGGRTYVGGAFTRVGRRSGSGAVLSSAGTVGSFPEVAGGDVHAAISDRNGGWYVGGSFTTVGGQPHVGLAHVKGDGSVDPGFDVSVTNDGGMPAPVYALALSPPRPDGDRVLYVGGEFTRVVAGGSLQGRRNLAALRASNGSVNGSFATVTTCPYPPACQGAVRALALTQVTFNGHPDQSVLFVGGDFTSVDTQQKQYPRNSIAAIWGVGATDAGGLPLDGEVTDWAPGSLSTCADCVGALSVSVRTIQVGPEFQTSCDSFAATPTCPFRIVYFGGWKATARSTGSPAAAASSFRIKNGAIDANPSLTVWKANPASAGCQDCAVRSMLLLGGSLYFGGEFTKVADPAVDASDLATIAQVTNPHDTTPIQATQLGAGVDGSVRALAPSATSPTTLLAAGGFTQRIAALDTASGTPDAGWTTPAPDSAVNVLATDAAGQSTTSVYAGGEFRSLGSVARHGLAAFDSAGSLLGWAPDLRGGAAAEPRVHALAASDSTVYVGGQFDSAPGAGGAGLAAIDAASGALTTFPDVVQSAGGPPDVLALSLLGSTLYVGGAFDRIGGQDRANLAALDAGTGAVKADWSPAGVAKAGDKPAVRAILPACGAVYVGGWFDSAGGQPRENLAALDPATGLATPWAPHADGTVFALARYGPTLYAGGTFSHVAGALRQRLAGLNVSDGQVTPFDASVDGQTLGSSVRALAVSDSALYLGGHFADVGGSPRSHLAAVDPSTGQTLGWDPGVGRSDVDTRVDALALGSDTLYAGGTFGNVGSSAQRGLGGFGAGAGSPFTGGECLRTATTDPGGSPPGGAPFNPAGGPPPASRPRSRTVSTVLSAVVLRPGRVVTRGPLSVTFRLSRAARVRLRFARQVRGRYVSFADMTVRGRKGFNRVAFRDLRVGGRRLVSGRYRLRLAPLPGAAGARPSSVYFLVRVGRR
jgi:hypothetical protein